MNRSSRRTGEGGFHLVKCGRLFVLALMATAIVAAMAAEVSATTTRAEARLPEAGSSTCPSGSKRAVIAGKPRCLRTGQPCAKRNEAAYKKHGFTCVNGHLRKRTVAPAPSPTPPPASLPPPPPASPAQPGHYKGTTSQLEIIEFDVTADGIHVAALFTGQINEGCTPPAHLFGGNFRGGSALITSAGDFTISFDYTGTVGEFPSTGHFTITGHFAGATATGTLQDSTNFTANGTPYACGSGLQTWTAVRSG